MKNGGKKMMKRKLFVLLLTMAVVGSTWIPAFPVFADVGNTFYEQFTDPDLAEMVAVECGKSASEAIETSDVDNLTSFETTLYNKVSSIEGLELFTNLEHLDFYGNDVSDISVLANLTK